MSEWTHVLTIAVPESLIAQANQLALSIGTSEDDVNNFHAADWTDGADNFAVCSTRAVDKVFDYVVLITSAIGGVFFRCLALSETGGVYSQ